MKRPTTLSALLFALAAFSLAALFTGRTGAEIFKYVDRDGTIHFTNMPTVQQSRQVLLPPVTPENFKKYFPNAPFPSYSYRSMPLINLPSQAQYESHIRLTCSRYGLDCNLVKAVIRAESGFNSQAVSPKGAMGLMQLMPGTSRDLGVVDPFDPFQNIDGGVRYLRMMMDRFNNNVHYALAAYNAGPEAVERYSGIPPYDETQIYVKTVMDFYSRYR